MKRGFTLVELLVLLLFAFAAWGVWKAGSSGFAFLKGEPDESGKIVVVQVQVPVPATENPEPPPEPTKGPDLSGEVRESLVRSCFDGKSSLWLDLRTGPNETEAMPVEEEVWENVAEGDSLEVFVPGRGKVSVEVAKKYRKIDPRKPGKVRSN